MSSRTHDENRPGETSAFASEEVPLYYQLATVLRDKVTSGEYAPGERIPSESELVEAYGVSRMTVRQALSNLEAEGLISRRVGRGTFVAEELPLSANDVELDHSIGDLISMGLTTSVELLELKEVAASPREARDLGVDESAPIIRCRRLRRFQGDPYCYIVNHVPLEIGRRIETERWRHGSVLQFIEEDLGIPLLIAEQRLRATLADPVLARWLQTRIGAPLLLVDYHIGSTEGRPVEMAELYYRSDLYSFTLHLTRTGEAAVDDAWSLREHRFEH